MWYESEGGVEQMVERRLKQVAETKRKPWLRVVLLSYQL